MNGSDFIEPPPGLIPGGTPEAPPAATVRQAPKRVERALPSFTPPAFAAPPKPAAVPTSPPAVPPKPPAVPPAQAVTSPTPTAASSWRLLDAAGAVVHVEGRTVLGRAPHAEAVPGAARAVAVDDPARTVSKTHALVEPASAVLLVTDLGSTNGVRIEYADGRTRELRPGTPTEVAANDTLLLGEFRLLVAGATRPTV
ncbi:FHA domain-containing protein [Agromyces sp. CFH 90414]|uniref:FHA domain-containing protein n=1 Tax=Agromyces agglutinans TaxID=2662258 RepID=A0A6I2F4S5_9MICO|nr:FHA domain-containing protein [Agromyces agglutinans]MRG58737.1 FHA domain-containing protein [Agromyces agglutinans]